ncbi:protein of unknown function [Kyrpidia spormannii]|uniref:Uncharacterized protein n=1 Tax=Kyrpidia spormannii TaxID=2055160 RepID=A0ACA8ZEE3_9BACL|nr:protein of unknown function [Kyrpidia spormannii]
MTAKVNRQFMPSQEGPFMGPFPFLGNLYKQHFYIQRGGLAHAVEAVGGFDACRYRWWIRSGLSG